MNIDMSNLKERIYFQKTREYFIEVEKSFYDGNYRSATVMLYSVIIADLLYKLEELRDLYQDGVATDILKKINKLRNENRNNSEWETQLIKEVVERTELIEDITYTNLEHLKKLRNFSAHPALDNDNKLIAPIRETICGLIDEMLNKILIRPPMYASKIIDLITNDISKMKWLYWEDKEKFEVYLNKKYLNRMGKIMKMQVFKAFWKFVFKLEDEECNSNRDINLQFIKIIMQQNKLKCIEAIRDENQFYNQINNNADINQYLIEFLYDFPDVFEMLETPTKLTLDLVYREKPYLNLISHYKYSNIDEFLASIKSNQLTEPKYIKLLEKYIIEQEKEASLYDKYIEIIKESSSFNESDRLFSYIILNNVEKFSKTQTISLIEIINENDQIYNRNRSYNDNNKIIEKKSKCLGGEFDYKKYENFKFSEEVLEQNLLPF